ncbi:MAG: AAA family ATPase [Symploca sp. SIO2E6]|nr:AAA family ATPase [Symploca sp. SIO2E6]
MNITEILQFADDLVFAHQGKHLDDLQELVLKGVYQGKNYREIAEQSQWSESRVRNIASELWQLLSEELGEDIKKSNFRSTLKRVYIESSHNICIGTNHNFHLKSQVIKERNQESYTNSKSTSIDHDLTLAPQITIFYNRTTELEQLNNWIFKQNTRLISVLGLSGIGKTTLVKRFVDLNLYKFEVVIWRSLYFTKSLESLIDDLLNIYQQEPKKTLDDKLTQLFYILNQKRCLIIIDDVQNIFIKGNLAGKYQPAYQGFQKFFTMITETQHPSNVILISQEQCTEMECLDEDLYPLKCLHLSGLNDVKILEFMGLRDEDSWLKLIQLYECNPFYLKNIANSIKNIFDGCVAEFLSENELIITKDIQDTLQLLFDKLSFTEQKIAFQMSKLEQPVSRKDLKDSLELSSTDFINGLESLQRRYLVTQIKKDKILFKLSPFFQKHIAK